MRKTASALFCGCSLLVCAPAMAQDRPTTLNYFGMPGLVDMPTANVLPDAELAFTLAAFASTGRGTLSFQALPSVTASFRYAGLDGFRPGGNVTGQDPTYYDRSFDVHWQVIREGGWWPATCNRSQRYRRNGHLQRRIYCCDTPFWRRRSVVRHCRRGIWAPWRTRRLFEPVRTGRSAKTGCGAGRHD